MKKVYRLANIYFFQMTINMLQCGKNTQFSRYYVLSLGFRLQ